MNPNGKLARAGLLGLALVISLSLLGVSYATYVGGVSQKGVVMSPGCSDPFTWIYSNDDGHEDIPPGYTSPVDPGDVSTGETYDGIWGSSSSADPSGPPSDCGQEAPRYDKDVARTSASIGADPKFATVIVENAYPFYNPTSCFAFHCEQADGLITDIVIDNPDPGALTVTYSGIFVGETIPMGQEAVGVLHILVNQAAQPSHTYSIQLSISVQCSPPVTCGSAYASGGAGVAACFLDLGFTNWGWTNGPLASPTNGGSIIWTWPLYAGAAQCDMNRGANVGTVTVTYFKSGTKTTTVKGKIVTTPVYSVTVTFNLTGGAVMSATNVYVGSGRFPKDKKGIETINPGQYPYIHTGLNNATIDSFTIYDISGPIHIIAHANTCWPTP